MPLGRFLRGGQDVGQDLNYQKGEKGSAGLRLGRFRRGGQDMGRLGRFLCGRQDVGQEFGSPEGRKGKRRIAAWPLFAWRTRCGTRF